MPERDQEMKKEEKIVFYMHAGSGNHGCEAIVNSLSHMLKEKPLVLSNSVSEDGRYSLAELCELAQERQFAGHKPAHVFYYLWRMLLHDPESFIRYRYRAVFGSLFSGKKRYPLAVSIGGDNYCYDMMIKDLMLANSAFNRRGTATVLLGCSIEPELLKRADIREDLGRYRAIIARESITFEALQRELEGRTRLFLFPDPAFTLAARELPLPAGFAEGNTIGINISPMVQERESIEGITLSNYEALIRHIIDSTDMQIALIPHVVWERNDDRKPIGRLYETFKDTGRVVLIGDASCEELKGYIGRCRMFIGARTHATIAAYSSLVPTLVVGYSVKARGIAKDLFGTWDNYVVPVQTLEHREELIRAFEWLRGQEEAIRRRLSEIMPSYRESAWRTGKEVEKLWEESGTR